MVCVLDVVATVFTWYTAPEYNRFYYGTIKRLKKITCHGKVKDCLRKAPCSSLKDSQRYNTGPTDKEISRDV
jgi:hypothetical protein